jgi:rubrerythrin
MKKYKCKKCGYSTIKSAQPESCNYCSKKGTMQAESDAQEILSDD